MPRDHVEQFEKDRLGNVYRKPNEYAARVGAGDEAANGGLLTIAAGDADTTQVLFELPDDVDEVVVDKVRVYANVGTGGGNVTLREVTLNDDDTIDTDVQRSAPLRVAADATETFDYGGEAFTDHIGVQATVASTVTVHCVAIHHESTEPASEQTQV